MFIAALFTITISQITEASQVSIDEWIKKMWNTERMEYYSAIKKNEILPLAMAWMEREYYAKQNKSVTER